MLNKKALILSAGSFVVASMLVGAAVYAQLRNGSYTFGSGRDDARKRNDARRF